MCCWVNTNHVCPGKSSWIHRKLFIKGIYFLIYGKLFEQNVLELVPERPYKHHQLLWYSALCRIFPVMFVIDYLNSTTTVKKDFLLFKREMLSSFKALSKTLNLQRPEATWIVYLCIWICLLRVHNPEKIPFSLLRQLTVCIKICFFGQSFSWKRSAHSSPVLSWILFKSPLTYQGSDIDRLVISTLHKMKREVDWFHFFLIVLLQKYRKIIYAYIK